MIRYETIARQVVRRLRHSRIAFVLYQYGLLSGDTIYGEEYYTRMDRESAIEDAREFHAIVLERFDIDQVIEFGCGTGRLLYPYFEDGASVKGIDQSRYAIQESELPKDCLEQHDLREYYKTDQKYDLALCIELLEHLPESAADTIVATISDAADLAVVTAASPDQGGTHHVNEQPKKYWINKFESQGLEFKPELTEEIQSRFRPTDLTWIPENLLVFERQDS